MAKAVSKKDVDFLGIFPLLPDETIEYTPERWRLIDPMPVFELRGSRESESAMRRKMFDGLRLAYIGIADKDGETEEEKEGRIASQEQKSHNVFLNFIFGHIVSWRNIKSAKGKGIELSEETFKLLAEACPTLADDLMAQIGKISLMSNGLKANLK